MDIELVIEREGDELRIRPARRRMGEPRHNRAFDLNLTRGGAQQGQRPVLIISSLAFKRVGGVVWACPISQGGQGLRENDETVSLMACGTKMQAVVLYHPP